MAEPAAGHDDVDDGLGPHGGPIAGAEPGGVPQSSYTLYGRLLGGEGR